MKKHYLYLDSIQPIVLFSLPSACCDVNSSHTSILLNWKIFGQLKARYGGVYVFTMTTSSDHEGYVEDMVKRLASGAKKIYHLSGTQKFELPKHDVRIAEVFLAVEEAKSRFTVLAWGLSDTTLEDVFIKVANSAKSSHTLS